MAVQPALAAVLTGDLVDSTSKSSSEINRAIGQVNSLAATVSNSWPGNDRDYFTRFRGDGWQFLLPRASQALRALICVHAALRRVEGLPLSRISIGIGSIDPIDGQDLSAASGSALITSGQALDKMEKTRLFTVSGEGITPLHHAVLDLVEEHILRWTPEQAEAALWFLSPKNPTQKSIAESLQISTQAVHSRLKGAGAHALRRAIDAWESDWEGPHD